MMKQTFDLFFYKKMSTEQAVCLLHLGPSVTEIDGASRTLLSESSGSQPY